MTGHSQKDEGHPGLATVNRNVQLPVLMLYIASDAVAVQLPGVIEHAGLGGSTDHVQVVLAEPLVIVAWSVPVAGQAARLGGQSVIVHVGPVPTVAQQLFVLEQPWQSVTVAQ